MSLDDETPTQHFGTDGVELTIQGKRVRIPKSQYLRLTETPGALTDEEMLHAKVDGLSLADILTEANRTIPDDGHVELPGGWCVPKSQAVIWHHHSGCASHRGRSCNCAYFDQWSQP